MLLVRIARTLLDQIGLTIEAVEVYGKEVRELQQKQPEILTQNIQTSEWTPLQQQTFSLIDRFVQMDVTLPNQLGELCNMILNGDSVALDGISDNNLRERLEKLFREAGLTKTRNGGR